MYLQILQKKKLKYFRDPDGTVHMGTTANKDCVDKY